MKEQIRMNEILNTLKGMEARMNNIQTTINNQTEAIKIFRELINSPQVTNNKGVSVVSAPLSDTFAESTKEELINETLRRITDKDIRDMTRIRLRGIIGKALDLKQENKSKGCYKTFRYKHGTKEMWVHCGDIVTNPIKLVLCPDCKDFEEHKKHCGCCDEIKKGCGNKVYDRDGHSYFTCGKMDDAFIPSIKLCDKCTKQDKSVLFNDTVNDTVKKDNSIKQLLDRDYISDKDMCNFMDKVKDSQKGRCK